MIKLHTHITWFHSNWCELCDESTHLIGDGWVQLKFCHTYINLYNHGNGMQMRTENSGVSHIDSWKKKFQCISNEWICLDTNHSAVNTWHSFVHSS